MDQIVYGIDIGTSNFKMSCGDKILNERNIIAKNKKGMIACGDEAYDMYEKAPSNIDISFPVSYGVIADIGNMQLILQSFFKKMNNFKKQPAPADFYIAVPTDVTEVEKRAFYELVLQSKIKTKDVLVVDKPIADAVGAGLDVLKNPGIMIVNMGAETCEISILSMGGIVISKSIKMGGSKMDESIIGAVRKEYNLLIGKKTAERLKISLASATHPLPGREATCFGRNVLSGLPVSCKISAMTVYKAISEPVHIIMDAVRMILEQSPPELAENILKQGIFLTGGTSQINNLKDFFRQELKMSISLVERPQESIVRGLTVIARRPEFFNLAYFPDDTILD